MVGNPFYYDKKTEDLARKAIGRGLVITLQGIPDDELINLYQYAKALIYPTKYEGFGLPVIEAMSCGCPVITTKSTGTAEAAGDAAFFIEPTTDMIMFGINHIEHWRDKLIKSGLKHASTFSWEKIAADYEKALDNC
jgi:mannosyltransferase